MFRKNKEDALTDPINATSDQSTATLFPRLPYKLPTALITATIGGLVMRMSGFGINDSVVATLGFVGAIWFGSIFIESFRSNRIRRAIFKKYPNGVIWKDRLFTLQVTIGLTDFDNDEIGAAVVDDASETGYQAYKFSDIDVEFVLSAPLNAGGSDGPA
tara:strand:- start:7 stop:483 length:477 start_codon:yes stop_codon:yes gene_type:complete